MVLFRAGHLLLVRKRGTRSFILPGGKPLPGEPPESCAVRELLEETGLCLSRAEIRPFGEYTVPSAHEPDVLIHALLFSGEVSGTPHPSSEIEEVMWHPIHGDETRLAPLIVYCVLPRLRGARSVQGESTGPA